MHLRRRHLTSLALKRLRLHPVIGILGARQVGKSTWLRDIIGPSVRSEYVTFDKKLAQSRAAKAPEFFLLSLTNQLSRMGLIDEVQKVPDIFDSIKAVVDENRRPGLFLITGSTEFSKKTGIRESLTGRIGILRMFPLTLAELAQRELVSSWVCLKPGPPHSRPKEIETWIERGGMPGICSLHDTKERHALWESWIDTTCNRDITQIKGFELDGRLAEDILQTLANSKVPTAAEIARQLRTDSRKIHKHLSALEALFVVYRMDPHPLGIGKPRYMLFDSGLAWHMGASENQRLAIWAMNECLAQNSYAATERLRLYYYESSKHSYVDFVLEKGKQTTAVLLTDEEAPGTYTLRTVEAFHKKAPHAKALILAPGREIAKTHPWCTVVPWAAMG